MSIMKINEFGSMSCWSVTRGLSFYSTKIRRRQKIQESSGVRVENGFITLLVNIRETGLSSRALHQHQRLVEWVQTSWP